MKALLARVARSQFARDVGFAALLASTAIFLAVVYVFTPYQ